MAYIALNNAAIQQSTKSNHVTYTERYQSGERCAARDEDGNCLRWEPVYSNATHNSNAKITGKVSSPNNKMFVNSVPVACIGDPTQEQWIADPTPYSHYGGSITSISPGTSGSGKGTIATGNSKKVYLNGKLVAVQGSTVTTHLGTSTTISEGNSLVNM